MVANTNVAFALNWAVELLIIIINQELMQTSVHQQATLLMTVFKSIKLLTVLILY